MADPVSITLSLAQIIVPPIIEKLLEEWRERGQLQRGLGEQIPRLSSKMQLLKKFLNDADKKQGQSETVHGWLRDLKEVVYDAEDVLDEYATDVAILQMEPDSSPINSRGWRVKVSRYLTCCFTSHPDIAGPVKINNGNFVKDIENINIELDDLYRRASGLGLQVLPESHQHSQIHGNSLGWRKTTSIPDDFQLEGREKDKTKIIEKLLPKLGKQGETSSSEHKNMSHISIIPIVGMGGLGKTTLARSIFNDDDVKVHFRDSRAWVCVSENCDVENLTKTIIESIYCLQGKKQTCNWSDLEHMQKDLLDLVEGKNFLLILDDVWSESTMFWESLLKPLRAVQSGCQYVVLTTRIAKIRNFIEGCMDNTVLKCLKDEQLWNIFHMYAFDGRDENQNNYKQLEAIGKTIVTKLKGSPLAAKSIGRLLGANFNPKYWRDISKSELLKRGQGDDDILPILFLSYQHLPTYLKQCLTYFSLFPKDYLFNEFEMISLWMANGYIRKEEGMSVEDVAKTYLQALVDRSFLDCDYGHNSYSMHDLIHDLVQSISEHDFYWLNDNKEIKKENPLRFRHMSFIKAKDENFIKEMCGLEYRKTRTMLFNDHPNFRKIYDMSGHLLETTKNLRALVFSGCNLVVLPECIYKLKHLRLLDISNTFVKFLSESLGNLFNLQVLRLSYYNRIKGLPNSISRLVNLRHLIGEDTIFSSLKGIGRLCELRSTIVFSIRDEDGFHIHELKDLNFLKERLEICNLELVKNKEHALETRIEKKEDLKCLVLKWTNERMIDNNQQIKVEEDVLEALKPYQGLSEICVDGYIGMNPPSWLNESWLGSLETLKMVCCSKLDRMPPIEAWLNSLCILKLDSCSNLKNLSPHLGKMQFLRWLCLKRLHSVEEIKWEMEDGECCLFEALEDLTFGDMPKLVEWRVNGVEEEKRESIRIFPRLTDLEIEKCPKLNYVDIPLLATILRFPNKCIVDASTTYGNHVDETVVTPYVANGLTSLKCVKINECPHIICCDLLPTMTSLEHFELQSCRSLIRLRFPTCARSMKWLGVRECPKLESCKLPPPPANYNQMMIKRMDGLTCVQVGSSSFFEYLQWVIEFPLTPTFYSSSSSLLSSPPTLAIANSQVHGPFFPLPRTIEGLGFLNLEQDEIAELLPQIKTCSVVALKALRIEGYDEIQLALPNLTASLTKLHLEDCRQLESLPVFSDTLETFRLINCPLLPSSLDLRHCMSLERVEITSCPSLASLLLPLSISMDDVMIRSCPNLHQLISINPPYLSPASSSSLPPTRPMLQVRGLDIGSRNREQVTALLLQIHPAHLERLHINGCSELEHFDVDGGRGVQLGPTLFSFTSLRTLWIFACENLKSLPSDFSTRLLLLEQIGLWDCPLLSCLPDLRPLTSLRTLDIVRCPLLSCLPDLRPLTSLRTLGIVRCPLLSCLPDLRPLTSLRYLGISGCPKLAEKYKDDIQSQAFSHILHVEIS